MCDLKARGKSRSLPTRFPGKLAGVYTVRVSRTPPGPRKRKRDERASSLVPGSVTKQVIRIQPLRVETLVTLILNAARVTLAAPSCLRDSRERHCVGRADPFLRRVRPSGCRECRRRYLCDRRA